MSTKLRLGPLPGTDMVKLTITLRAALNAELDRYAELHAQTWGTSVDATRLIPHMLESFIAHDRLFCVKLCSLRVTHCGDHRFNISESSGSCIKPHDLAETSESGLADPSNMPFFHLSSDATASNEGC
jgi:hypothetical protein